MSRWILLTLLAALGCDTPTTWYPDNEEMA